VNGHAGVNQWTTGPLGGTVIDLRIDPTAPERVFVAAPGGVYRSLDHGADWQLVYTDLYPRWIAFDSTTSPATVYVVLHDGVVQSDDGGDTWSDIAEGLPSFGGMDEYAEMIAVAPTNPATLYLGTSDWSVYRTTRGDSSWDTLSLSMGTVKSLELFPEDPEQVLIGIWGGGILLSDDAGDTWNDVSSGLSDLYVHHCTLDPHTPSTMYAAMSGGLYRTNDAGASWSHIGTEIAVPRNVAVDPVSPTTVYVGSRYGGAYRSTDGGDTWSTINEGLPYVSVGSFEVDPATPSTLYAGTSGGVFRSDNGGASWSEANENLVATSGHDFAFDATSINNGFSAVYVATDAVFRSTDAGESWKPVSDGLHDTYVRSLAIDPTSPETMYAGTWGQGMYKTTDGGEVWNPINTGIDPLELYGFVRDIAMDPSDPSILYCTGGRSMYKTTDAGLHWYQIITGLPSSYFLSYSLAIDPVSPATVFLGTHKSIFKTTNGGEQWMPANEGLPEAEIRAIDIDPSNTNNVYAATSDSGVYRSTDGGATWSEANVGIESLWVGALIVDPVRPTTLFAGTSDGVFQSINSAATWTRLNKGLPEGTWITALGLDPNQPERLYAGANNRGVFLIDLDPAVSGFVWNDNDENGQRGELEPSFIGIEVRLLNAAGGQINSTFTDAQGYYSFNDLPWGDYMVEFSSPQGWVFSPATADADDATDSDADPDSGRTAPAYVYAGRIYLSLGAGLMDALLHADDFESGDTTAWTITIPGL
jgi:photosystem II stability/assembly factor-like uncharacterized protein